MRALKNAVLKRLGSQRLAVCCAPLRMIRNLLGWRRVKPGLADCRRILVVRPDEIGDVVLTSPFFRNLRSSAPHAHITVATNETCRPLLENCPHVDEVYSLPFKPSLEAAHRARLVIAAIKLKWSRLWRGFDLVLLPRVDADWYNAELAAHLLAGRGTVAMNTAGFISWSLRPPESLHLADARHVAETPQSDSRANLQFLHWCGGQVDVGVLEYWCTESDEQVVRKWLEDFPRSGSAIVFHPPGSHSALRRWASGRSRQLVQRLLDATDCSVIVVGGPIDAWLETEFAGMEHPRLRVAAGRFTLPQLGCLIRQCGYFVGGDSGPMHIAAAVGARTVGIFGPGSEVRFKPWSDRSAVVSLRYDCSPDKKQTYEACCQQCIHPENRCLTELSADRVLREALEFFELTQDAGVSGGDRVQDKT